MNAKRRKDLAMVIERVNELQSMIEDIYADLEQLRDDEQECYDNLPESIQYGERGDNMQSAIDEMESALSSLEDIKDCTIDEIIESIDNAINA